MDRVLQTLSNYLTGNTTSPDSVITQPFDSNIFVVGTMRDFTEIGSEYDRVQFVTQMISTNPNPKWLRDFYTISLQTIGEDRSRYIESEDLLHEVFETLHSSPTLTFGDSAYFQFTSDEGPHFAAYLENSMPMFNAVLQFYVDGLVDKNNREALK